MYPERDIFSYKNPSVSASVRHIVVLYLNEWHIHPSIYLFMKNNIVETSKMTVEQDAQGTYNAR